MTWEPHMQIVQDRGDSRFFIRSFKPGEIKINDQVYHQSVVVSQSQLIDNWPPQTIAELTAADIEFLAEQSADIYLLGTGEKQVFPDTKTQGIEKEKQKK